MAKAKKKPHVYKHQVTETEKATKKVTGKEALQALIASKVDKTPDPRPGGARRWLTNEETKLFESGEMGFKPDWEARWTVEKIEQECEGFKFQGPGWYFEKDKKGELCVTLIMPTENPDVWLFMAYNTTKPINAINWMVRAPVRKDER